MRQRWPVLLIALLVLPSPTRGKIGGAETLSAQTTSQSLTRPAAIATPRVQLPGEAWEIRTRIVTVDLTGLPNRATAGSAPATDPTVRIDLFNGQFIQAAFERFDPNASGVTWVGTVPSAPGSHVTIVYGGGTMAASIILPDAAYTIRPMSVDPQNPTPPTATPLYVLAEVDEARLPREAEPLTVPAVPTAMDAAADVVMSDGADVIELLVVYTAAAEAWAGGPAGIVNWINLGVSETNTAYETSGVNQRVSLLHTERVAYTEVNAFQTNLTNLRGGAAVGLGDVAGLREAYSADLVSMFVRPAVPDACGIAFLMTSVSTTFAPNGYSVVDASCVSPNGTLAHELGHNMGLRHDWYMDNGVTPSTYAHGYVNLIGRFRTIMSYPDGCLAAGISCTRILAFSNPDQTLLGVPMGVPGGTKSNCPTGNPQNMTCDADERRALNDSALSVANFRQATTLRPPAIVGHPASQSVVRGQSVTLQVTASGLGPFSYQWYRGPSSATLYPIAGATGPTFTFTPGADGIWSERWFYWARVSNAIGAASSFAATITLLPGNASDPSPRRSAQGQDATPPARTAITQARPRTLALTGTVAGGSGSAHSVGAPAAPVNIELSGPCSANVSILQAVADLAEYSGNDELAMFAWLLRTQAIVASGATGCGGDK